MSTRLPEMPLPSASRTKNAERNCHKNGQRTGHQFTGRNDECQATCGVSEEAGRRIRCTQLGRPDGNVRRSGRSALSPSPTGTFLLGILMTRISSAPARTVACLHAGLAKGTSKTSRET